MVKIQSDKVEIVPLSKLTPHPENMHEHSDEQIDRLIDLINYQGWRNPIVVQKGTNLIVAGHGRCLAARKMGMDKVPVLYQEFESEEQLYAYIVSDNAIGKDTWATLDYSMINAKIADMGPEFDIDLLGIKDFVIEPAEKFEPQADEDEVPEVESPITKRGDIWLLGNHRVMCGDSTMIDDVEKLMNGKKADMVYTDPPYGMNLDTSYSNSMDEIRTQRNYKKVAGDRDDFSEDLINTIFAFSYVKEMFVWGFDYFAELIPDRNNGSNFVWHKTKDISHCSFGSEFELCWSKNKHKKKVFQVTQKGFFGHNKKDDGDKRVHPTQKNVALHEAVFSEWCEGLNLCVDLYLGSGSTLIACEKTNRKCYGMEIDEHYCDVIVKRWQNYTGKEATLESTGETYNSLRGE